MMNSEVSEGDQLDQQRPVTPFEVGADGVIQPGHAESGSVEADEADRIDQATPVPADDDDDPAGWVQD